MTDNPGVTPAADEALPVGTLVAYWPGAQSEPPRVSRTRSAPWRLGHGTLVVAVEGYPGGIALSHVAPLPEPPAALPSPGPRDDRLRALSEAATQGPWMDFEPDALPGMHFLAAHDGGESARHMASMADGNTTDAAYIVALVNWHRALLVGDGGQAQPEGGERS